MHEQSASLYHHLALFNLYIETQVFEAAAFEALGDIKFPKFGTRRDFPQG